MEVEASDEPVGEPIESREEEVEPGKSLPTPTMPTQSELDEHRDNGHIPYRQWCSQCVEGFGREKPHLGGAGKTRSIPLISCDYLFVTARGVFTRSEFVPVEGEEVLKVLVVYDGATGSLFAHAVPRKGPDEHGYVVDQIVADVLW